MRTSTTVVSTLCALGVALVLGSAPAQAATPSHLYLLDDATDEFGGPSLTSLGGIFGNSEYGQIGYRFDTNRGLALIDAIDDSVYSIDFSFALDANDDWRRLIEFKNLGAQTGTDTGLYIRNRRLNFYPVVIGADALNPSRLVRITITRTSDGLFSGYMDGMPQFSFQDNGGLGEFTGPDQIAYFFRDDNVFGGEASAGFVDYIAIYDTALSAVEVATLTPAVPEPAAWMLMLAGGAAVLTRHSRVARPMPSDERDRQRADHI